MTGKDKKMNYPETYIIRLDKRSKKRLKKYDADAVRKHLSNIGN